jgi:hypothetical protein
MPVNDDAMMELARLAHLFWCGRMLRDGWRYADRYDAVLRTHDALQPFERLDARDKQNARSIMELEAFASRLAEALDYPRGPDRPFEADEMRIGLRVGWASYVRLADRDASTQVGVVESWELDADTKELTLLRVRWEAGDLTEHSPDERDLIRLDPS